MYCALSCVREGEGRGEAIRATKAAVEEGIVPGGGSTLVHISTKLLDWAKKSLKDDELLGALIVEKA